MAGRGRNGGGNHTPHTKTTETTLTQWRACFMTAAALFDYVLLALEGVSGACACIHQCLWPAGWPHSWCWVTLDTPTSLFTCRPPTVCVSGSVGCDCAFQCLFTNAGAWNRDPHNEAARLRGCLGCIAPSSGGWRCAPCVRSPLPAPDLHAQSPFSCRMLSLAPAACLNTRPTLLAPWCQPGCLANFV